MGATSLEKVTSAARPAGALPGSASAEKAKTMAAQATARSDLFISLHLNSVS
jgi:hypothetical protein